jgi:hypothetical protein
MAINGEYHLGIMLINPLVTECPYDLNAAMTQDFGDLTAVYVFENKKKYALISKEFCKINNIRVNELHAAALQQQREYHSFVFESLETFVQDIFPEIVEPENEMLYPVWMLSMDSDTHGASVILQPEALIAIEEIFGGDYFILPSSIHEVIVVPDLGIDDQEHDLNEMVRKVNHMVVDPEDRLSDRVIRASEFLRLIEPPEKRIGRDPQL